MKSKFIIISIAIVVMVVVAAAVVMMMMMMMTVSGKEGKRVEGGGGRDGVKRSTSGFRATQGCKEHVSNRTPRSRMLKLGAQ